MDHVVFVRALERLSVDDIRALARDLGTSTASPADDVALARATLHIEHAVRRRHRKAEAGTAGHAASRAVVAVAEREGVALPDPDVTRVARAAAQIARGLVVAEVTAADLRLLALPWSRVPEAMVLTAVTAA